MDMLSLVFCIFAAISVALGICIACGCAADLKKTRLHPPKLLGRLPHIRFLEKAAEASSKAKRKKVCVDELPQLLDIVTLGLSAGLSFDSSLELYCERYDTDLSRLCSTAMLGWRMGAVSREKGMQSMAADIETQSMQRFVSVVNESLRFGSPLAKILEEQAILIRDEQRSFIEEEIERLPVKMLIPLGTLIVPAMFLAILGPLLGSAFLV